MFGKRHLFILILLLLFKGFLFSQSTDSLTKDICSKYQAIYNNLKSYDTVTIDIEDESTEGGQATGYYKKKDLKCIKAVYFAEIGKAEMEYYFDDGLLIFVFQKQLSYNRPIYWDKKNAQENGDSVIFDPAKTITTENRFYYHKEKLIRLVHNERNELDLSVYSNSVIGESLIAHVYKLRDKLKK